MRLGEASPVARKLAEIYSTVKKNFPDSPDSTEILVSSQILKKVFLDSSADDSKVVDLMRKSLVNVKVSKTMARKYGIKGRLVYRDTKRFWIGPDSVKTHNQFSVKQPEMNSPIRCTMSKWNEIIEKGITPVEPEVDESPRDDAKAPEPEPVAVVSVLDGSDLGKLKNPEIPDGVFYYPPSAPEILESMKANENLYIYGPSGCGKSHMAELLCKELELEPLTVDFSAGIDEATFLGSKVVKVDDDGNRVIEFEYGIFPQAVLSGRPLIINEIDFAQPRYLSALHGILEENDPHLVLMDNGGEVLRPPEDGNFFVIATANTLGLGDDMADYHGTNPLNAAFLDRFDSFFQLGYTPNELEIVKKIISDREASKNIMNMVKDIRALKDEGAISGLFTTRRVKMFTKKIPRLGITRAFENVVLTRMEEDDREQVLEVAQRHFPTYFSKI